MKVQEIMTGRSARLLRLSHPNGGLPLLALIKAAKERYHFLSSPSDSDLSKVLEEKSAVFEQGTFNGHIIKRVVVGEGFLICDVHGTTNVADELARDIYNWIIDDWGYRQKDDGYWAQAYASEIEFTADPQAVSKFQIWLSVADKITKLVRDYGSEAASYSIDRIALAPASSTIGLRTIPFAIEHRNDTPPHLGIWYSAAPLKTDDHLALLREIIVS